MFTDDLFILYPMFWEGEGRGEGRVGEEGADGEGTRGEGKEQMERGQEGRSWKGEKGGKEREYYCVAALLF